MPRQDRNIFSGQHLALLGLFRQETQAASSPTVISHPPKARVNRATIFHLVKVPELSRDLWEGGG